MEGNKYPVIKFNPQLWDEIRPIVVKWGCEIICGCFLEDACMIVSNYGNERNDFVKIGYTSNTSTSGRRYLVKTKDEFLSAVAKLLGKTYNNTNSSVITLRKKNKLVLNFKI